MSAPPITTGLRIFTSILLLATATQAHEQHSTLAEITHQPSTQTLEITLSVHTEDLEAAINLTQKDPVRMDQTPAAILTPILKKYLRRSFILTDTSGTHLPLRWIGHEPEPEAAHQTLLLHFEIALPDHPQGLHLRQSTFHELYPDQVNLILLRSATDPTATQPPNPQIHACTPDQPIHPLKLPKN